MFWELVFSLLIGCAAAQYRPESSAKINRQYAEIFPDGSYEHLFETENGIYGQESGVAGQSVQGLSKWTDGDGQSFEVAYVADENGYHPKGKHLPVSPPIPDAILRALAWIEAHPPKDDQYNRYNINNNQRQNYNKQSSNPFQSNYQKQQSFVKSINAAKSAFKPTAYKPTYKPSIFKSKAFNAFNRKYGF